MPAASARVGRGSHIIDSALPPESQANGGQAGWWELEVIGVTQPAVWDRIVAEKRLAWIDATTRLGADDWRVIALRVAKGPRKLENAEHVEFELSKRQTLARLPEAQAMSEARRRDLKPRDPAFFDGFAPTPEVPSAPRKRKRT